MLKWTATTQKTLPCVNSVKSLRPGTPRARQMRRKSQRNTIAANSMHTSTPLAPCDRNSSIVITPLTDILNITLESTPTSATPACTPKSRSKVLKNFQHVVAALPNRPHSTAGLSRIYKPQYASTLPRFEEEYSPSTTGQQLALRGLLPDAYLGNPRYFSTPEFAHQRQHDLKRKASLPLCQIPLPRKRKLEYEFTEISRQCVGVAGNKVETASHIATASSAKVDNQTLDQLIDVMLDTTRKEKKAQKPFKLRRRTLLKTPTEQLNKSELSTTYAAGDDPANDKSFLFSEIITTSLMNNNSNTPTRALKVFGAKLSSLTIPRQAPSTALPSLSTLYPVKQQLYTPSTGLKPINSTEIKTGSTNALESHCPVPFDSRGHRRNRRLTSAPTTVSVNYTLPFTDVNVAKKFKANTSNYFDVGVTLPSTSV